MTMIRQYGTGAAVPRGGGRPVALAVLCTLLFLTFLDNTVVSVGLGSVQADLHAGVLALQWVVGAYALTFASAMLGFGMVGDEFGRKKVMLAGAGVFCAGSVICALAPDAGVLIAGRAVMGLGAAASEPGTLSMLRHLYRDERTRNRAIGVWAAVSGLALAVGPVLGGALVGLWNWRAIFWFNLAFGAAALVAAAVVLPENADPEAHRVDVAGAMLGAAALAALIFGVMTGESTGFTAPAVLALFCGSAVAGCAFLWREYRAAHPLLDLRFLRVAQFTTANMVAFCSYFATFAIFFFTALYLDEVVGYSGFRIALAFLPMTVLMITSSVLAGIWLGSAGLRWSISAGCFTFAAGLLLTNAALSPQSAVCPAGRRARPDRRGYWLDGSADHIVRARRDPAGTFRHGRVGSEHQPRDRRRDRRGRAGRAGQRAAARRSHQQAESPRDSAQLPVHRGERGRDRRGAAQRHDLVSRRARQRRGGPAGDQRGLPRLRDRPARRPLSLGGAGHRRGDPGGGRAPPRQSGQGDAAQPGNAGTPTRDQ